MSRNIALDAKVFNLKRDVDQIARLYHPHQSEITQFLVEENASTKLEGMPNEQVYTLISDKLGYAVPG